jgi:chemotaxis protein MotB
MVIQMSNAILFDPGKTKVKPDGKEALASLSDVLQTVPERTFLVAGHTDNVPIKVSGFESNWDLSVARAMQVLRFLQDAGVAPDKLAAAGFGEYDPIASNDTEEGRALNRRTEIVLMPKINELPDVPKDLFEKSAENPRKDADTPEG